MFDSFIVAAKPEIDPNLPGYRKFWLRHKRGMMLTFWLAVWAQSIYDLFRMK